ncbi:MAG: hypothetical protein IPJ65_05375 [Archangiaceae bacterium]|nr:hypothetical protein [Archangiaceae bacterium]
MRRLGTTLWVGAALAIACGGPSGTDDAGFDAGPVDAGRHDSGVADAGSDAGPPDAGRDAGMTDSGTPDAGPPDAGPPDAGVDAGPPDAGPPPDGGCGCTGTDHCLLDGGCGQCSTSADCSGALPQCDTATAVCVGCLTAPADTCASGSYCVAQTCVQGCKSGSECASGICFANHDCFRCQGDLECNVGRLCGTGVCSAPCGDDAGTCAGSATCCNQRCVDTTADVRYCGGCGTACGRDDFCAASSCVPALLSNVCVQPKVRAVLDDQVPDDDAGTRIAQALVDACPVPGFSTIAQAELDAGYFDIDTAEPLQLGELVVAGGGSYFQHVVGWLEQSGAARVSETGTVQQYRYTLRDGGVISTGATSTLDAHHDVFVVQMTRSSSGAIVLTASGFYAPGTAAAAWYFVNVLLPMRASLADAWYLVEWTDGNADALPDATDTWSTIGSGH